MVVVATLHFEKIALKHNSPRILISSTNTHIVKAQTLSIFKTLLDCHFACEDKLRRCSQKFEEHNLKLKVSRLRVMIRGERQNLWVKVQGLFFSMAARRCKVCFSRSTWECRALCSCAFQVRHLQDRWCVSAASECLAPIRLMLLHIWFTCVCEHVRLCLQVPDRTGHLSASSSLSVKKSVSPNLPIPRRSSVVCVSSCAAFR